MKHLFLTGEVQVGKSTLLRAWMGAVSCSVGGFCTRKVPDGSHLYVRMFPGQAILSDTPFNASVQTPDNILFDCRDRDFERAAEAFDRIGCALLSDSQHADLIIMDEIGYMEGNATAFCQSVRSILDGPVPVLGVVRKKHTGHSPTNASPAGDQPRNTVDPDLIDTIFRHPRVEILEITRANRDTLALSLPEILLPFAAAGPAADRGI